VATDDRDPWDRLTGEGPAAYEAFRAFRDLGPTRSHAGVLGYSMGSMRRWSMKFRWRERAQAWDDETHRIEDARRLEQIRTMDDTHQRAARALITTALRAINALGDGGQLTPHQAARFLDLGTRLERATLLGEHLAAAPVAAVAEPDELSPLERIARELAGTA
jgi:hypothetical protein